MLLPRILSCLTLLACVSAPGAAAKTLYQGGTKEPLQVEFSRAFGVPADGSWVGLFSSENRLDPIRYASEKPEQAVFKSGQYALSSTTAGREIWYGTAASVWCYWPYISMKMPLTLMNYETPHHGCQMTPPGGQRGQLAIAAAVAAGAAVEEAARLVR